MTVLITLTIAGADTGPFDLYSDADGFVSPFESGISKAALQAGYLSTLVPNTATIIRVKSKGVCTNYIDIVIGATTTTTTSSSTSTTTTTSTSSTTTTTTTSVPPTTTTTTTSVPLTTTTTTTVVSPTTTTTTTIASECIEYYLDSNGTLASIEWFGCDSNFYTHTFNGQYTICTDGSGYTVTGGSVSEYNPPGPCLL